MNSTGPVIMGSMPRGGKASVISEVLRRFVMGERLTGMNAVTDASTTRLAAFVHTLESKYGWVIERKDKAIGSKDGRTAFIVEYFLPHAVCAAAMAGGAEIWCEAVRKARAALREKAPAARRRAKRINEERHAADPRQHDLFAGA